MQSFQNRISRTLFDRYGPQEGIRKLFDEDAELAEQFEKHLYHRETSRNGGTK